MRHYIFLLACLLLAGCQESFDERCRREAEDYTRKNCPYEVEAFNVLDSTTYDMASRTYCYWYTLSGQLDTPEAIQLMKDGEEQLRERLRASLINSIELKKCKEEGITFAYIYRSASSGLRVLDLRFGKEDYMPQQ